MIVSLSPVRRVWYELYLRTHQGLAGLAAFSLWRHISLSRSTTRYFLEIAVGILIVVTGIELCQITLRSFAWSAPPLQVDAIRVDNGTVEDHIRLNILIPRLWHVRAGQYINLYVPGISHWSFMESHPYAIASWTGGDNPSITCLIERHSGFSRRLLAVSHKANL